MDLMYGCIDIIGFIFCIIFTNMVFKEKTSQNQKYLLMTFVCGIFVSLGDLLEYYSTTMEAALTAVKFAYLGKTFIVLFALLFSMGFNQIKASQNVIRIVGLINIVLITIILTCELHSLYYTSISWEVLPSGRGLLRLEHGPFFYLWMTEFMVGIIWYAMHAVVTFSKYQNMSRESKTRMRLIIVSALGPFCFFIAQFITPIFDYFDWTTIAIVWMEGFMLLDVKKYGLLDTMQLAQERFLEDTKDGIIVVDESKSHIVLANTIARSLFPEITTGEQKRVIERVFVAQETILEENGKHYELRVSEIKSIAGNETVQGYVAWIFDMTFIDKYANEMIRLREESESANKAKTSFLAHMSHEIRTPMNAIVGFSELALRIRDENQRNEYLKNIRESAGTLLQLINEILDISKIESGKMEVVKVDYSISELIHELDNMLRPTAERKGLEFTFNIDEEIPDSLYGDRQKLHEIMLNIINNAIRYTKKGSVETRISLREKTQHHVRLHIEVEDTGIGIEEKNISTIFSAFEQFDHRKNYGVEGSGLGLSIVKRLVDMLSGEIRIESVYGKGSTFIIDIRQTIGEKIEEEEITDASFEPKPGKILVVDDNDLNCDVAQGILEVMGMDADVANSGMECINKITDDSSYDLIFMDHMMPEMDGVETLHRIRNLKNDAAKIPIVLLTANAINGNKEQMLNEGFDGFLSKPIDVDELKKLLIKFLGKKE